MGRMKLPCFDGRMENYDKWETEWAAFAEEEGLSGALGDCRDANMPDSSVFVVGKDAAGKLQAAAVKTNKRAMAYLALAFDTMRLLLLIIKAKSDDWPEGEAWKVMQFLRKKYCPDRVGLWKMIVKEEAVDECEDEAEDKCEEAVDECEDEAEEEREEAEEECEEAVDECEDEAEDKCEEAVDELNDLHAEEEVCNEDDESEEATEERKEAATEEHKEAATEERKEAAAEECEEAEDEAVESNAEKEVAEEEEKVADEEEEVRHENEVKEEYCEAEVRHENEDQSEEETNKNVEEKVAEEEQKEDHEESNAEKEVAEEEEKVADEEEEVRHENEVKEEYCEEEVRHENEEYCEEEVRPENEVLENGEGHWMLVARARRSGREAKAIMRKAVKMKKNVGCVRVQSHNGRVSEVSCENCTHTAIAAKQKGCYTQRDSGGVWTTPEMSGQGSRWDTEGMYEGENTAVI
jgi:hypothetical protein